MDIINKLTVDEKIQLGLLAVAIIGIFMAWWQLRQSVKSQRIQLLHDMNNELRGLHLKLMELVVSIKEKKQVDSSEEHKTLVTEYLNYMEHLSLLINEKYIDEAIAKKIFKRLVVDDTPNNFKDELREEIYTEYYKLMRRWRGGVNMEHKSFWLNIFKLTISMGFIVVSWYIFKIAYNLILSGVTGEFKILSNFSGWQLYLASIFPGIVFGLLGVWIILRAIPYALKAL